MPSRQYAWQQKMRAQGRCTICGWLRAPRSASYCAYHAQTQAARLLALKHEKLGRPPRALRCSYCRKQGHNRRSHERLLPRGAKPSSQFG